MNRFALALLGIILAAPVVAAQSLNDESVLANDPVFLARVRQSIITQAVNISSDGLTTPAINAERHRQVVSILTSPDSWKVLFAQTIVTQSTVINPATVNGTVAITLANAPAQGALVSDTVINTTVAAVFNSFFGGQ
jgi:hypothetical protein